MEDYLGNPGLAVLSLFVTLNDARPRLAYRGTEIQFMAQDSSTNSPQSRWPTLEEQLRESRVRPGSKLEESIKENQDFSLLRPEEAHDQIRIPLWLRVQYRKRHPASTPTPGDPTGGYPLALRDLYLWMVEHQDLPVQNGDEKSNGN
jgi:hypothetical protein